MESENEIQKVPEKVIGGGVIKETKVETKEESKEVIKEETKKEGPKKVYQMELVKELDNIFILGRGQSLGYCPVKKPEKSEFWGCNNIYKAREVDRLFIMHDVYVTQYNRGTKIIEEANEKGFPVYTLGKYEELKNNIQYPIQEVIKEFNIAYFLTNISYMLALAIMQRPKNLCLFGVDMDFGTAREYMQNEKSCLEYWLGVATGKKIRFHLSQGSTLMRRKGRGNYYGMVAKIDKQNHTLQLDPVYKWGKVKSALKYKVVKVAHNL
ncbi:hypothetical protein ES705_46115 [subsurface metagenome]